VSRPPDARTAPRGNPPGADVGSPLAHPGSSMTMVFRTRLAVPSDAATIAEIYNQASTSGSRPSRPRGARRRTSRLSSSRRATGIPRSWSSAMGRSWPGAGRAALDALAREYATRGFWKLVSRIFPQNAGSLALHARAGFRTVGVYRRHGKLEGEWRDCVIV